MKAFLPAAIAAAALALAAPAAQGQSRDGEWYGGISYAPRTQVQFDDNFLAISAANTLKKDETDKGYKLFAGRRMNRNFALEGGFTDFGKFSFRRDANSGNASLGLNLKSSGFHFDALGILPVGGFDLFLKGGLIYTTTKADFTSTNIIGPPGNAKKSEFDPKIGLGAEYRFASGLGLRAEYEQAFSVGDKNTTGEGDIQMFSVGLTFRF